MDRITEFLHRSALGGLAGIALAAFIGGAAGEAAAQFKGSTYRDARPEKARTPEEFNHGTVLRISEGDMMPAHRQVRIARNKSLMVELPRGVRDVLVSDPEVVDAVVQTSNRVFLVAKSKTAGQANAFFLDENGDRILTLEITIDRDTVQLQDFLNKHLPGSRIKVEMISESIVLTGSVPSPAASNQAYDIATRFAVMPYGEAEKDKRFQMKVINLLSVEGEEQVMLRVTVAEVQRSLLKQFGINIGAIINSGNFTTHVLTENALPLTAAQGLGTLAVPAIPTVGAAAGALNLFNQGPISDLAPFGNSGTSGFWNTGNQSVAHTMRALERDGLVKTLAEPNLTAVSGEPAKFLAGGEYPIPVVDSDGKLSVIYKEFGVGVAFTPTVLSEGRISLKIETEVSELSNQGAVQLANLQIPALKKRQAKSTVELPSGGSLAIAGLISDDTRQNIDGFPGLKDVPILGTLFRSRDFIKQETELVIMVTPYMVKPTARKELARPVDGLGDPTDRKGIFLGHLNRIYGRANVAPPGDLKGDYGFIVE